MAPPIRLPLDWPADVMSAGQVAQTIHVHPKTVRQDIRLGVLAARDISSGGKRPDYRIDARDAQAWWDERLVRPGRRDTADSLVRSGQAKVMRRGRLNVDRAVAS